MTRLLKIFIFVFSFAFLALRFLPPPAKASYLDLQGQNPSETFKQALESNSMNYSQFSLISVDQIMMGLTKKMVNYPALEGETNDTSLLNSTGKAIGFLYTNQPSLINYLAYEGQRLNLIKPAYAATGGGWNWLNTGPTLTIWTISRNVSYLFFVVIFVAVGFMIMFRSKLNPQTVINIQLALPRIVIALIMVTFSYAICGFIVDVVFLGHGLIQNVFTKQGGDPCGSGKEHFVIDLTSGIRWEENCTNNLLTPSAWPIHIMTKYGGTGIIDQMMAGMGKILGAAAGGSMGFEGLFQLILAFSVIGATFKIFFSLLTKYVMIIISVIFMPFSFLGSALSTQSNPIKPLKALLANTISFPVVSLLLALAYYFSAPGVSTDSLAPFYINEFTTGTASSYGGSVSRGLVAIGILMAIPTILASIDKMFEAQPITQAATEQIGGAFRKIPVIGGMMG